VNLFFIKSEIHSDFFRLVNNPVGSRALCTTAHRTSASITPMDQPLTGPAPHAAPD
jgi:hypothetical protein